MTGILPVFFCAATGVQNLSFTLHKTTKQVFFHQRKSGGGREYYKVVKIYIREELQYANELYRLKENTRGCDRR